MTVIWAKQALTHRGWEHNVRVTIDATGKIDSLASGQAASGHQVGILLPAPVNAHSHAFQRAMAGLTERRGPDAQDSFWTWRQLMYRFLQQLKPHHIEAISAYVQMQMLEAGYAAHVEFHYLHHQPDGSTYARLAEMSERVIAATAQSGIGLTLVPVYYQYGGCDGRRLQGGQLRFGNDLTRFSQLLSQAQAALTQLPEDAQIGLAVHSLRAVPRDCFADIIDLAGDKPIHMHLAEQVAEVEEVQQAWGKRPVEWLLDHVAIDQQWCLIHCTQMQAHETTRLAATGAVAGLCPITEASLGDGIFDGVRWLANNGRIALGSDCNIRIALAEELRLLDYTQRLRDGSRAALASAQKSTGRRLYDAINRGGAQAAGRASGRIVVGAWADLLTLDDKAIDLADRQDDTIIDSFVFAGDERMICDVWSAGRHLVQHGQHIARDVISANYRALLKELKDIL